MERVGGVSSERQAQGPRPLWIAGIRVESSQNLIMDVRVTVTWLVTAAGPPL